MNPWEEESNQVIFAARLRPHRSLNPRRVRWIVGGLGAASGFLVLPFVFRGAWPVIGFVAVNLLVVWLAFRASFRQARAYEDVKVTALEVAIEKSSPEGRRRQWRLNPRWVRIVEDKDPDYGVSRLALASSGRQIEVGDFLGAAAKEDLSQALASALAEARRGPRFS